MASAFVTRIPEPPTAAGSDILVRFEVVFNGTDVPNGVDISTVDVTITASDTANTLRNKIGSAVQAEATRVGYTVPTGQITVPAYQRV